MGILQNIKAVFSATPYIESALRLVDGVGMGPRNRPFNPEAVRVAFEAWVHAAATLNANAVASVPLRLYTRDGSAIARKYQTRKVSPYVARSLKSGVYSNRTSCKAATFGNDLVEVTESNPVIETLRTASDWSNGYELFALMMYDLQLMGNAYLLPIAGTDGQPTQVVRLAPQDVRIIPSAGYIGGYEFGGPNGRKYAPEDVDHYRTPNPFSYLYGLGWVQAAWTAISAHGAKRRMDLAKFDNNARPDYIVAFKGLQNKDALDRFENKIKENHGGTRNAGKMIALNGDVTATPLNFDVPEHGTPNRIIEEIAAVSGVPVAMLLSNDPNRANSQAARVGWYRNTIKPYCRNIEEQLNQRWLPRFAGGEEMILAHDPVSFEDEFEQTKRLTGLVAGGLLTPNEARQEMGYPNIDDGDKIYPPSGLTSAGAAVGGNADPRQTGGALGATNEDD